MPLLSHFLLFSVYIYIQNLNVFIYVYTQSPNMFIYLYITLWLFLLPTIQLKCYTPRSTRCVSRSRSRYNDAWNACTFSFIRRSNTHTHNTQYSIPFHIHTRLRRASSARRVRDESCRLVWAFGVLLVY